MKKVVFFIIIIISLVIIRNSIQSIYDLWQKQDLITHATAQLQKEKNENSALKKQLQVVKSQQFINEEAHDKLFLVKPGEQVVVIPQNLVQTDSQVKKKQLPSPPNWQQWLTLFFKQS